MPVDGSTKSDPKPEAFELMSDTPMPLRSVVQR
jgi:hypothetical protein